MNVLISSGGTVEKIDAVRGITNFSTGRLGSLIAESFSRANAKVWYLHGVRAAIPNCNVINSEFESVAELQSGIRNILSSQNIDVIVHAAAVSDYSVVELTRPDGAQLERNKKISSAEPELILKLVQTPKIIAELRKLAPNAVIVGFKLLDNVPYSALLAAATNTMTANDCDFVLMNDSSTFSGDTHIGYLLDRQLSATKFQTKQEIADGIVRAVTRKIYG